MNKALTLLRWLSRHKIQTRRRAFQSRSLWHEPGTIGPGQAEVNSDIFLPLGVAECGPEARNLSFGDGFIHVYVFIPFYTKGIVMTWGLFMKFCLPHQPAMIIRIKDDKRNGKITKKTIWWNHKSAKDIIWRYLKPFKSTNQSLLGEYSRFWRISPDFWLDPARNKTQEVCLTAVK